MAANRVINCDAGQSISQALRRAEPGATIAVRGICRERVVITQPVTLDGGGSAVVDGSASATLAQLPVLPELDGVMGDRWRFGEAQGEETRVERSGMMRHFENGTI